MRQADSSRPSRLLRVREVGDNNAKKSTGKKGKSPKSRFIAPFYFKDVDQDAIRGMLQDASLSDDDSRSLFITAAEYEVGALQLALRDEPALKPVPKAKIPSEEDTQLEQLGDSAQQLIGALGKTNKTARKRLGRRLSEDDVFHRQHGEDYFAQVSQELKRIVDICAQYQTPAAPETPPVSENVRKFVVQLARIFSECLEVELDESTEEIFCRILCIIRDDAELYIPCEPEVVSGLLNEKFAP